MLDRIGEKLSCFIDLRCLKKIQFVRKIRRRRHPDHKSLVLRLQTSSNENKATMVEGCNSGSRTITRKEVRAHYHDNLFALKLPTQQIILCNWIIQSYMEKIFNSGKSLYALIVSKTNGISVDSVRRLETN